MDGLAGDDWMSGGGGGHAFPRRVLSLGLDGDEDVNLVRLGSRSGGCDGGDLDDGDADGDGATTLA
jgi:hypothetical protein